jgi:elongation factor 2 kinase
MADTASNRTAHVRALWRAAARHARSCTRAYEAEHAFLASGTATERCVRHSYDALSDSWVTTETFCRLETTPFAEGAMRRCYRLLKATQAPGVSAEYASDFHHASSYGAFCRHRLHPLLHF